MDLAEKIYNALMEARKTGPLSKEVWLETVRTTIAKGKREAKRASVSDEAEAIFQAYPRKMAKLEALVAITKALKNTDADTLLAATKAYAAAVARWPKERHQYIPQPATWFNGGRYLDDPSAWESEFKITRPQPKQEDDGDLPEPARYEEWFRAHYEQEPRRWETLARDCQLYYLRMMRQLGVLTPSAKHFVGHEQIADMVAKAFKAE